MFSLPHELLLYIIDFDNNEYYKKQYNKCLTELKQIKHKSIIIDYLKPLHFYYDIYYDRINSSKMIYADNCSKYILTMIRKYSNMTIKIINAEHLICSNIKPSLIYNTR